MHGDGNFNLMQFSAEKSQRSLMQFSCIDFSIKLHSSYSLNGFVVAAAVERWSTSKKNIMKNVCISNSRYDFLPRWILNLCLKKRWERERDKEVIGNAYTVTRYLNGLDGWLNKVICHRQSHIHTNWIWEMQMRTKIPRN